MFMTQNHRFNLLIMFHRWLDWSSWYLLHLCPCLPCGIISQITPYSIWIAGAAIANGGCIRHDSHWFVSAFWQLYSKFTFPLQLSSFLWSLALETYLLDPLGWNINPHLHGITIPSSNATPKTPSSHPPSADFFQQGGCEFWSRPDMVVHLTLAPLSVFGASKMHPAFRLRILVAPSPQILETKHANMREIFTYRIHVTTGIASKMGNKLGLLMTQAVVTFPYFS